MQPCLFQDERHRFALSHQVPAKSHAKHTRSASVTLEEMGQCVLAGAPWKGIISKHVRKQAAFSSLVLHFLH